MGRKIYPQTQRVVDARRSRQRGQRHTDRLRRPLRRIVGHLGQLAGVGCPRRQDKPRVVRGDTHPPRDFHDALRDRQGNGVHQRPTDHEPPQRSDDHVHLLLERRPFIHLHILIFLWIRIVSHSGHQRREVLHILLVALLFLFVTRRHVLDVPQHHDRKLIKIHSPGSVLIRTSKAMVEVCFRGILVHITHNHPQLRQIDGVVPVLVVHVEKRLQYPSHRHQGHLRI
mmetsp:Transcript_52903/g.140663  ORF Transcript_52903/g.140663 Transcript_52903/m.140663 type:complete len:227 (+) Transcript_52903:192-872(+)